MVEFGEHDTGGIDGNAALAHPRGDQPAQRLVAERRIVAQLVFRRASEHGAHRAIDAFRRQPVLRQPTGGRVQLIRPVLHRRPDDGEQIDGGIEARRLGEHERLRRRGDEEAGPAPRLDQPLRREAVVGLDDGGLGNAEFVAEPADRRQPGARARAPGCRCAGAKCRKPGRRGSSRYRQTSCCPQIVPVQFSDISARCLFRQPRDSLILDRRRSSQQSGGVAPLLPAIRGFEEKKS